MGSSGVRVKSTRAVVLGGTGFLGSAIASALRDSGSEVLVVARSEPRAEVAHLIEGCDFLKLDVAMTGLERTVISSADLVVHAIGTSLPEESNADPVADSSTALVSILRTLEALRDISDVRLVYLSSGGTVYGNQAKLPIAESAPCAPISSYGIMKLAAERYIGMYRSIHGVAGTALRVANAYGPGQPARPSQGFIAACLDALVHARPLRLYGGGSAVRDFVFVDDVVGAVLALSEVAYPPEIVNVGSGIGVSLAEIVRLVEEVTGEELQLEHVDPRSVDVHSVVLDVGLLGTLMDWHPVPITAGLEKTWESWRDTL